MQMGSGGPGRPRGSLCPERAPDGRGLSSSGWVGGLQLHPTLATCAAEAAHGTCWPGQQSVAPWRPLCCRVLSQGRWVQGVRQ